MSEKKKKNDKRVGTIPFVLLWTLSYGLGWASLIGIIFLLESLSTGFLDRLPDLVLVVAFGMIPGLLSGVIQQPLLRWKFGTQIKRWWLWSTIGSIAAMGGYYLYAEYLQFAIRPFFRYLEQFNEQAEPVIIIGILFVLYSTFQAWALRHTVRRVWLWSLAAFVSASTFILPLINTATSSELTMTLLTGLAGLLQGSVMALTLVWLFGMTRTEPLKRGMSAEQMKQAEEKLTQSDMIHESSANYPEEQSLRQRQ
jgi:hypothetical protein